MIINYNINDYPFRELVCEILEVDDLYNIHKIYYDENFKREKYLEGVGGALQDTYFHRKFYKNKDKFVKLYDKFVNQVVAKTYNENFLYQTVPTFRVQACNSVSVIGVEHSENSKKIGIEGIHRDKDYNHSKEEINYYLPFVDTNKYNTIWAETEPDKGDYSPFLLKYGEVKKWRGSKLMHGNIVNVSKKSRVSVDFRIIPVSKYVEDGSKTLTNEIEFKIGNYWSELKSE